LSSINDNIKLATGGNSVADGLSSWYSRTGNESLDDAESRWLSGIDTQGGGSNSDMWFNVLRSAGYSGSLSDMKADYWESPITFPSELTDLKLWNRFDQGITVTGSGVSQWDDVSGNGNHLKQTTDNRRPAKQSDGSILFDAINDFLQADAFILTQPETIYLLVKQVTWDNGDAIFDGNTLNTGRLYQNGTTPTLSCYAGADGANTTDLALDTYGVITVVFDHDNSLNLLQVNSGTPSTDTAFGTADMGGFILGAVATPSNYSNIQIKEVLVYSAAHDAATRAKGIAYLSSVGGL